LVAAGADVEIRGEEVLGAARAVAGKANSKSVAIVATKVFLIFMVFSFYNCNK